MSYFSFLPCNWSLLSKTCHYYLLFFLLFRMSTRGYHSYLTSFCSTFFPFVLVTYWGVHERGVIHRQVGEDLSSIISIRSMYCFRGLNFRLLVTLNFIQPLRLHSLILSSLFSILTSYRIESGKPTLFTTGHGVHSYPLSWCRESPGTTPVSCWENGYLCVCV